MKYWYSKDVIKQLDEWYIVENQFLNYFVKITGEKYIVASICLCVGNKRFIEDNLNDVR